MDQQVMAQALRAVLGAGYEAESSMPQGISKSPSPHDFLQGRVQPNQAVGEIETIDLRKDATGVDLHVPQTMGNQLKSSLKPVSHIKAKGKFRSVESVPVPMGKSLLHPSQEAQNKLGEGLTTAGAAGGVLSLPGLASHTAAKLQEGGALNSHIATGVSRKIGGVLKPLADAAHKLPGLKVEGEGLRNPRLGAGLAAGAAGLEVAGLAGDFMARHNFKQQRVAKADDLELETFSKVDDDKRQVFGWVSISKKDGVDVVDLQGDIVPIEEIEKSAYDYMLKSRKGGNQHARVYSDLGDEPHHVADVIESVVYTPEKIEKMGLPADHTQGWWMGMQIFDDETWRQIKSGERAGFSIHGKGKREQIVAKAKPPKPQPDRVEQAKDTALGASGAVAAGSGAGATLIPKIAAKTGKDMIRAEKISGRLKVIGATLGGTAGVYGGIHAAHRAATGKQPIYQNIPGTSGGGLVRKDWSTYDMQRKQRSNSEIAGDAKRFIAERDRTGRPYNAPAAPGRVRGAWSPVVHQSTLEHNRGERAKTYEAGAVGTAAGLGGAAAVQGVRALRAHRAGREFDEAMIQHVIGVNRQGALKNLQGRLEQKSNRRGVNFLVDNHLKANGKSDADIRRIAAEHNLKAGENTLKAGKLARKAGVLGAAALGAGAVAEEIHHRRTGSWRPYPGIR